MRKLLILFLLLPFVLEAQQPEVKRYRFQDTRRELNAPKGFVNLSDGTIILLWYAYNSPANDTCFIRARRILESGAAGPVMLLDALPAKNLAVDISAPVALSKKTFGFLVTERSSHDGKVYFSSYSEAGKPVLYHQMVDADASFAFTPDLAADGKGNLVACWCERLREGPAVAFAVLDAKGRTKAGPYWMDTTLAAPVLPKVACRSGHLVISCTVGGEEPYQAFRIFSYAGIPVGPLVKNKLPERRSPGGSAVVFISAKEIALSMDLFSYSAIPANQQVADSSWVVVNVYDLDGNKQRTITFADRPLTSNSQLAATKENLVVSWCTIDDSARGVSRSTIISAKDFQSPGITTLETLSPGERYSWFNAHPAKPYLHLIFNVCERNDGQQVLSYALFKKAKKPKRQEEKKPEKAPEEKTAPAPAPEKIRGR